MSKFGDYVKQESGLSKASAEPSKGPELNKVATAKPDPSFTQTGPIVPVGPGNGGSGGAGPRDEPYRHVPFR